MRAGVVMVLVGGSALVVTVGGRGYPQVRVTMSGGGAWLASTSRGLVTLVDGASDEVVGSLPAPGSERGDDLSVVQSGTSAYVVDGTQGTVSRVDGASFDASTPVRFAAGGSGSLGVFASERTLYVVDGQRQVASVTDPVSLRRRELLSLSAQPGPGQSIMDRSGRLWVVDSGGLARFDGGSKRVRRDVGDGAAQLVLVRGEPVLVDLSRPRLGQLSSDGSVGAWRCLDVRAHASVRLLGSQSSSRVYAAIPASGTLVSASVDRDDCSSAVVVGKPGDDLGQPVEAAGYVFVANRTTGETAVVDVASRRVRTLAVAKPGSRLELLAKDGFVFYNDLDSDRAGVIRLDHGEWRLGRSLHKYDGPGAGKGALTRASGHAPPVRPPVDTGAKPPAGEPARPGTADRPRPPGPTPSAGAGQPPGRPTGPPVIVDITWAPDPVVRWQAVTFTGHVDNAQDATWRWTLVAQDGTTVHTSTAVGGFTFTPQPGHGTEFLITLTVQGPLGTATATRHVTTTASLQPNITDLAADNHNPRIGTEVTFSATEPVAGPRGHWTWVVTNLDTGIAAGPPVERPAQQAFQFTFTEAGRYSVRLQVDFDGATDQKELVVTVTGLFTLTVTTTGAGGSIVANDGTLTCNGNTCTGQYAPGSQAAFTALPSDGNRFDRWTGCAPDTRPNCQLLMDRDRTVSANFAPGPPPSPHLSAAGRTVGIGTGTANISLSGANNQVTFTATGTDPLTPVTSVEIWVSSSWDCFGPGNHGGGGDSGPTRVAVAAGGSVSFTLDADLRHGIMPCFPPAPIFTHVTFTVTARASNRSSTSAFTDSFFVNYSP